MKIETLAALAVLLVLPVVLIRQRALVNGEQWPAVDLSISDSPITWDTWSMGVIGAPGAIDDMPDQLPGLLPALWNRAADAVQSLPQSMGITAMVPDYSARNVAAFLDLIAFAEGTSGPNGYRTMFGGKLFDSFADHPRVFHTFTNGRGQTLRTSAAGRYQFLSRTWDAIRLRLSLPDFGPESQDAAAVELVREQGALSDVRAGRIAAAVVKCAPVWASLPGAGYAQPEKKMPALVAAFTAAGGVMEV